MDEDSPYVAVLEFMQLLPPSTLDSLYRYTACSTSTYRALSPVSKILIARLMLVDGSEVPFQHAARWFKPDVEKKLSKAVALLRKLRILNDRPGLCLSETFCDSFRAFTVGTENLKRVFVMGDLEAKHQKTSDELRAYGKQRWESVLYFLALPPEKDGEGQKVSVECRDVLSFSGFINMGSSSSTAVEITSKGFCFLLMEPHAQIWAYLIIYLNYLRDKGKDVAEFLAFLFELSTCTLGQAYSSQGFSDAVQDFMQHLREIGLVFQAKRKLMRFFPTHLAINLLSGAQAHGSILKSETGFIVVETNFRVYAYTDSDLMRAIVATFTDLTYRFPGFCVGVITRETVRKALQAGISATQIVEFVRSNAHESMKTNKSPDAPLIPPNITDQLRLWETERDRFQFEDGVLYSQFLSDQDFEQLRDYAKGIGALLWQNVSHRTMIVDSDYHDDVKRFWKIQKGND